MSNADVARRVVFEAGGVVSRRDHRELRNAFDWLVKTGELVAVLPGVLAAASLANTFEARVAAVALWDPDAVVIGRAAARLGFWPGARDDVVEVVTRRRPAPREGFVFRRVRLDPDEVVEDPGSGVRHSSPGWTALWLARWDHGEATDEALRATAVTPEGLMELMAHFRGRVGAPLRRFVAVHSREKPWSVAERMMHVAMREAGITGWKGNHVFHLAGRSWPADIVFEKIRLVIEFDGFESHSRRDVFHADHEKALLLMSEGWLVVRFSWEQLRDREQMLRWIRDAMAMATALSS
ncbi:endonuclease domain-containing protein [Luteococcus sp. OSA5]|uniref:endonuclease domain-containing protein n=1 Tax=Luteococcus sp. OSA5 TaxID=3401630 RepID=UPI003B436891